MQHSSAISCLAVRAASSGTKQLSSLYVEKQALASALKVLGGVVKRFAPATKRVAVPGSVQAHTATSQLARSPYMAASPVTRTSSALNRAYNATSEAVKKVGRPAAVLTAGAAAGAGGSYALSAGEDRLAKKYMGMFSAGDFVPIGYDKDIAAARAYRKDNPNQFFHTDISDNAFARKVPHYADKRLPTNYLGMYRPGPFTEEVVYNTQLTKGNGTPQNKEFLGNLFNNTARHESAHVRQNIGGPGFVHNYIDGVSSTASKDSPKQIEQEASLVELKQWLREFKPEILDGNGIKTTAELLEAIKAFPYRNAYHEDLLESTPEAQDEVFRLWPGIAQRQSSAVMLGKTAAATSSIVRSASCSRAITGTQAANGLGILELLRRRVTQ